MKNDFRHRMRRKMVLAAVLCMILGTMSSCGKKETSAVGNTDTSTETSETLTSETVASSETPSAGETTASDAAAESESASTSSETADEAEMIVYSGTPDTSWYTGKASEYTLDTAEQLMGFQQLRTEGNTFEGVIIKLGDDITVNAGTAEEIKANEEESYKWAVLNSENEFRGVFDGQNHTISGIYMQLGKSGNKGMFGTLGESAVIKNFTLVNSYFGGPSEANKNTFGAIAGQITGSNVIISNVTCDVIVEEGEGTNLKWVGGFVGKVNAVAGLTMENCTFSGRVSVTGEGVGGLIGFVSHSQAQVTMKNCHMTGSVAAGDYCGTLIGYAKKYKTLVIDLECSGTGQIICSGANYGGVIGNDGK